LAVGCLIGAVLGLTGAGGSVLAVPLLFLLHIDPVSATGLALGVVASSSAYCAVQRIRHHEVLWIPALLFGASGALFAPPGRWLASYIPVSVLLGGFALLALGIAFRMLHQSIKQPEQACVVRAGDHLQDPAEPLLCRLSDGGHFDWRLRCMAGLSGGGVLTGLLSGLFGVGGGFLIVPFLNQLNGVPMRQAVATSLVIIAVISSSGFITHVAVYSVDWIVLGQLALGGTTGMALGSIIAKKLAGVHLQQFFAATIIVMALLLLWRAI
jgi:hypothetical protein